MSTRMPVIVVLQVVCALLLACNSGQADEPVSGAEITIECEPGGESFKGTTDAKGVFAFSIPVPDPAAPRITGMKTYVGFPEGTWKPLAAKMKKTEHLGTYHFKRILTIGNKTYEGTFVQVIKGEDDIRATSMNASGPYGQSTSNIEDNGKVLPPNSPRQIQIRFTLICTKLDRPHGIIDEGIE